MFAQGVGYAFQRIVLSERLHNLRAEVGRLTFDITRVMDDLVDAEVEVARIDPENVTVAGSAASMFVAEYPWRLGADPDARSTSCGSWQPAQPTPASPHV